MPFTPAHPAIVLPFINKRVLSATALIMGSISPDFEYFFKAHVNSSHSHTWAGLFYFDLPVALFLCFVFHLLVKENLVSNLPPFLQRRFVKMQRLNFKTYFSEHYAVVICSVIVGSCSHLFWDSFTHDGGFFVSHLDVYKQVYVPFQGVNYPLFYALQHISTYAGLVAIGIYILLMPADTSITPGSPSVRYWLSFLLIGSTFFLLRFTLFPNHFNLGNAVVTAISSILISLCALGYSKTFRSASYQNNVQA